MRTPMKICCYPGVIKAGGFIAASRGGGGGFGLQRARV